MPITWDETLPQYADVQGFGQGKQQAKIETAMDTGPRVMRSLFTAVPTQYTLQITLTDAQVDTFDTFYSTTCKNGTLPFEWKHPRKPTAETTVEMRFIGEPPAVTYVNYDTYNAQFVVEVLP